MRSSVVLLSGGIDSTVTAYIAKKELGKTGKLYAISFDYGQKHSRELDCALEIGELLNVDLHPLILLPFVPIFGGPLTGKGSIPVKEEAGKVAATWVPQRNSIFLSIAFGYAESVEADRVYIGANSLDYSGYPDCRPEFMEKINLALNLASKKFVETGRGIGIAAPLQYLTKAAIIKKGLELGVDFSKTWSCYRGGDKACGRCPSCLIRLKGFKEAGIKDPIEYEVLNG